MSEIINCPRCNAIFMQNKFRDVCDKCYREGENMYETVYQFLKKRENRAATMARVIEMTGVDEELLYKWVKKGRIQTRQFPKMGYPCDKCGKIIGTRRICEGCSSELLNDLKQFEAEQDWKVKVKESGQKTYYTMKNRE
ncbi:TIGR03826 family flagellar region protein [Bacillus sp. es.034]|uniref:TIGR03826 family flagellar region protein n=1 Tax=Bacillus sp. es.034 TaxID=1761763 RepID=UPI000BF67EBE|nr:TIGR03826 family flagellar region protein [Bacillus sp. es.034]PFG04655.1 flagellar operon protein (TIGR03826 family) [Bacillus sp. es.034]